MKTGSTGALCEIIIYYLEIIKYASAKVCRVPGFAFSYLFKGIFSL
jgi:hypothetical protein